ncbi:MAG: TatD family hydrolase [Candidatus Babeliaceae bacterium]|jgi:TatD DNase family protein
MFIDTHCHINIIIKKDFDTYITSEDFQKSKKIIEEAEKKSVAKIINVATSLIESLNSIHLAVAYPQIYATVGIHPNDCTENWQQDFNEIKKLVQEKEKNKIHGIGECGLDFHYPDYTIQRQKDAFKAHIELALEHNLALVVHTRDAGEETLRSLEEFKNSPLRGVIHCFSETLLFAEYAINNNFLLGIGGTVTYPKNNTLREVVKAVDVNNIVLETDAPFLPPQSLRGKQNHPQNIPLIAEYIAQLCNTSLENVARTTTDNAIKLFNLPG